MRRRITGVAGTVLLTILAACGAGKPAPKDDRAQFVQECSGGDGSACYMLGLELDTGTPEERAKAAAYYAQAAVLLEPECTDDAQACLWLGDMYHWARGTPENEALAKSYYQRAITLLDRDCTDNNADACMELQSRYETGDGVDADADTAKAYYHKAAQIYCDAGDPEACNELLQLNMTKGE